MIVLHFAKNVRVPAKTKQDLSFWTGIAGSLFLEGRDYRFNDEFAAKLQRRFPAAVTVREVEEVLESEEIGVSSTTVGTYTDPHAKPPVSTVPQAATLQDVVDALRGGQEAEKVAPVAKNKGGRPRKTATPAAAAKPAGEKEPVPA